MKRILICGYYGFGNAGDEMILCSIVDSLKIGGYNDITVLSNSPSETIKEAGVKSADRWSVFGVFKAAACADILILGGGGLFQDSTSSLSLYYYLSIIALARLFSLKIILWSVGLGPLKPFNERLVKIFLKAADAGYFRDRCSYEAARVSLKKSFLIQDSVLAWNKDLKNKGTGKYALLCPRPSDNLDNTVSVMKEVAAYCRNTLGLKIAVVPFFKQQDGKICGDIARLICAELFCWSALDELFDFFRGKAAFCAAMRFHAAVLACKSGVPFVGITASYESCKLNRFLADQNLNNLEIPSGCIDRMKIASAIENSMKLKDDCGKEVLQTGLSEALDSI